MTTTLLVCETCGYDEQKPDAIRPGELLARALELEIARTDQPPRNPAALPRLQRYRCLMACKRHCVVQLRAPGKIGYVLGDFTVDETAARALLDYSAHYSESGTGQVAYALWPEPVKGKFIARIPVLED